MRRLYVVVEGQTEEAFARHVLGPHLSTNQIFVSPMIVTTRRDRVTGVKTGKGGGHWRHWRKDIGRLFRDRDPDLRVTTIFDLYGLPDDFPEMNVHGTCTDTRRRAEVLEHAMAQDIEDHRLIPYLQLHECEALVLAGLAELRSLLDAEEDVAGLEALRAEIRGNPPRGSQRWGRDGAIEAARAPRPELQEDLARPLSSRGRRARWNSSGLPSFQPMARAARTTLNLERPVAWVCGRSAARPSAA